MVEIHWNCTNMSIMELLDPFLTTICSGEMRDDFRLPISGEVPNIGDCRELSGLWLPFFCVPALIWLASLKCAPRPKSSREPFRFIKLSKLFARERAFLNIVLPTPTLRY